MKGRRGKKGEGRTYKGAGLDSGDDRKMSNHGFGDNSWVSIIFSVKYLYIYGFMNNCSLDIYMNKKKEIIVYNT